MTSRCPSYLNMTAPRSTQLITSRLLKISISRTRVTTPTAITSYSDCSLPHSTRMLSAGWLSSRWDAFPHRMIFLLTGSSTIVPLGKQYNHCLCFDKTRERRLELKNPPFVPKSQSMTTPKKFTMYKLSSTIRRTSRISRWSTPTASRLIPFS